MKINKNYLRLELLNDVKGEQITEAENFMPVTVNGTPIGFLVSEKDKAVIVVWEKYFDFIKNEETGEIESLDFTDGELILGDNNTFILGGNPQDD